MSVLRNGWTWFAALAVIGWLQWPIPDTSARDLRMCQTTGMATEAQRDGLMLQSILLSQEVNRLNGEVGKANAWSKGARQVITVLELKCRGVTP